MGFPASVDAQAMLEAVETGQRTLAGVAFQNMAAERCARGISTMIDQLPNRLKQALEKIRRHRTERRYAPSTSPHDVQSEKSGPEILSLSDDASGFVDAIGEKHPQTVTRHPFGILPATEVDPGRQNGKTSSASSSGLQHSSSLQQHLLGKNIPNLDAPPMLPLHGCLFDYPSQTLPSSSDHCQSGSEPLPMLHYNHEESNSNAIRIAGPTTRNNNPSYNDDDDDVEAQPPFGFAHHFLEGPSHDGGGVHIPSSGMDSFNDDDEQIGGGGFFGNDTPDFHYNNNSIYFRPEDQQGQQQATGSNISDTNVGDDIFNQDHWDDLLRRQGF
ncbi:MAG: hypothetical protein M1830_000411 [Pleopsidium flavum]|nr:MAG: hypothetical protein M1830_000411 [Pleopsidium flavum]